MFNKDEFGKVLVPMVTPFKEDQSVDYDAAVNVAKKLSKDNKADSIILTGTTGEFFSMNYEERANIFRVVKEEMNDKLPLIAGTGSISTIETIKLTQEAEILGYELAMIVAPYYTKPNQSGIYNHFRKIADAVDINIVLYNIPIFTGVNIAPNTLAKLAEVDNIVGVKEEAELNPKQITEYINITPEDFTIYDGDDAMILEAFSQGGEKRIGGVISGGSHLIGNQIRNMIEDFLNGNVEKAAKKQQQFLKLFRALSPGDRVNPASLLKYAMKLVGYDAGIPRLPLMPGTNEEKKLVKETMEELKII